MRRALTVLALAAVAVVPACGGDDGGGDGGERAATTAGGGEPERYCALVEELDERSEALADLPENPTEEEARQVFADFVEDNRELLDELVASAPAEIAGEVEAFVAAFRKAATEGDFTAIATAEHAGIDAYEAAHC